MVQACHVTLLNEADFNRDNMPRNHYPLVICYNGRDHFTPTKPTTDAQFYKWKLNRELGPIVSASLMVIEELDRHMLDPNILNAINQLEATIVQTLPIISPESYFFSKQTGSDTARRVDRSIWTSCSGHFCSSVFSPSLHSHTGPHSSCRCS